MSQPDRSSTSNVMNESKWLRRPETVNDSARVQWDLKIKKYSHFFTCLDLEQLYFKWNFQKRVSVSSFWVLACSAPSSSCFGSYYTVTVSVSFSLLLVTYCDVWTNNSRISMRIKAVRIVADGCSDISHLLILQLGCLLGRCPGCQHTCECPAYLHISSPLAKASTEHYSTSRVLYQSQCHVTPRVPGLGTHRIRNKYLSNLSQANKSILDKYPYFATLIMSTGRYFYAM